MSVECFSDLQSRMSCFCLSWKLVTKPLCDRLFWALVYDTTANYKRLYDFRIYVTLVIRSRSVPSTDIQGKNQIFFFFFYSIFNCIFCDFVEVCCEITKLSPKKKQYSQTVLLAYRTIEARTVVCDPNRSFNKLYLNCKYSISMPTNIGQPKHWY